MLIYVFDKNDANFYNVTKQCKASFCYRGNAEGVFEVTLTHIR